MAIVKTDAEWSASAKAFMCEFVLDTENDVKNLPTALPGSTALVVASGNVYMVNASGKWVKFGGAA